MAAERGSSMQYGLPRLGPLNSVRTPTLDVAYLDVGPTNRPTVVLLHGFPYDIHSYEDVIPILQQAGLRVVVPYLRGHGPTRSLDTQHATSGQQAALGTDVIEFMDALRIDRALLAGYDWGGRAACVVAATWPDRCTGLVVVNGYLIQDIASAGAPADPELEAGLWYFWYFCTERGKAGLTANRRAIAEVIWRRNSPQWAFDDAQLIRTAEAFENPDFVDVVVHSYRHRLGLADGHPRYQALEDRLAELPPIRVPTVTLDGLADGNFPATDGTTYAIHFPGPHTHRRVQGAGHNLPQEAPEAFASAVLDLIRSHPF